MLQNYFLLTRRASPIRTGWFLKHIKMTTFSLRQNGTNVMK